MPHRWPKSIFVAVLAACLLQAGCGGQLGAARGTPAAVAPATAAACTASTSAVDAAPSNVSARWQRSGDMPWSGRPFAISLGGPVGVQSGQPVPLDVQVARPAGVSSKEQLAAPIRLTVCIYAATEVASTKGVTASEHGAPVWVFSPPPLTAVRAGRGARLNFTWTGKDREGKAVPPGVYIADLHYPTTIAYTVAGRSATESVPVPARAPVTEGQYYRELVFVGSPGEPYSRDPRIQALASQLDLTLYVPNQIPGAPKVTSASTFAPPPLPGVVPGNTVHALIHYGDAMTEYVATAPSAMPSRIAGEKAFTIDAGAAGTVPAVAYLASRGHSAAKGEVTTYGVAMNVGGLSVSLQGSFSEADMIKLAKTLAPVAAVEP